MKTAEKTEMTIQEAQAEGYTCALSAEGDYFTYLEDADDLNNDIELFLGSKEPFYFTISELAMRDMIERHIEDQDQVNDESGQLYDLAGLIDFKAVCELVNSAFGTEYHNVTSIKLIL